MAYRHFYKKKRYYPKKKGGYRYKRKTVHGGSGPLMASLMLYLPTPIILPAVPRTTYCSWLALNLPGTPMSWVSGVKMSGTFRNRGENPLAVHFQLICTWTPIPVVSSTGQDGVVPCPPYENGTDIRVPVINKEQAQLVTERRMQFLLHQIVSRKWWFPIGRKHGYTPSGGVGPHRHYYLIFNVLASLNNAFAVNAVAELGYRA